MSDTNTELHNPAQRARPGRKVCKHDAEQRRLFTLSPTAMEG